LFKSILFYFCLYLFTTTLGIASTKHLNDAALLEAETLIYSQHNQKIIAKGRAKITIGDKSLSADQILYMRGNNAFIASGNGIFNDNSGNIYKFDHLKSDSNFKNITADNLRVNSKKVTNWSAKKGVAIGKNKKKVYDFAFSPCVNCEGDFVKDHLLWEIKAAEIELDDDAETLVLKNTRLEFLGKQIFTLSNLALPSFNAKPKSGFLTPGFDFSSELGIRLEIPYYLRIAPNIDATLAPIFSTEIEPFYKLEFRHLLESGEYKINSSVTRQKKTGQLAEWSGHIKAEGSFKGLDSNKNIGYGFQVNRLFNDNKTYLKKYKISEEEILPSGVYINHKDFGDSGQTHYSSVETIFFQDLRPDIDDSMTPNAIPILRYKSEMPIEFLNSKFEMDSIFYNVFTKSNENDTKLKLDMNLNQKLISAGGHELNFKTGLYNYMHTYRDFNIVQSPKKSINTVNVIPYMQTRWSYELMAPSKDNFLLVEPVVSVLIAPNHFFSQEVSALEIKKSNFLEPNRFLDWESSDFGSRIDYGANLHLNNSIFDAINIFLGGTFHAKNHNRRGRDYIANASLQLNQNTFLINRMWFDNSNFELKRHEVDSIMKFKRAELALSYSYKREYEDSTFPQEISGYIDFNFYRKLWLHLEGNFKLNNIYTEINKGINVHRTIVEDKKKVLKDGIGLIYNDDCLRVDIGLIRDHTKLKDLEPSTTYMIKVTVPIMNNL